MSSSNAVVKPVSPTLEEVFAQCLAYLKTMTPHFEEMCQTFLKDFEDYENAKSEYYSKHQKNIITIFCELDLNTLLQVQTYKAISSEFYSLDEEYNEHVMQKTLERTMKDAGHYIEFENAEIQVDVAYLLTTGETDDIHDPDFVYEFICAVFWAKIEKTGFRESCYSRYYEDFVRIMIDDDDDDDCRLFIPPRPADDEFIGRKEAKRKALGELDLEDKDSWADLLISFLETQEPKNVTEPIVKKPMTMAERNDAIVSAAIASKDDIVAKKIFTRMLTRINTY